MHDSPGWIQQTRSDGEDNMKPIIFSTEMVRAILDGRKTMTRRVCKPNQKPPFEAGDILWVREQWRVVDHKLVNGIWSAYVEFKADGERGAHLLWGDGKMTKYDRLSWRPSIHLPQKAARLFLQVVTVRAERLQDITEADAIQEGFGIPCKNPRPDASPWAVPPTLDFGFAWNKLNSKRGYGWDTNPFVWVIEFERVNHDGL